MTSTHAQPRSRLAVLAALGLSMVACSPALDWRTVRPEGAQGLLATFPCKPAQNQRTLAVPGLPGGSEQVHLASCKTGDTVWALTYFKVSDVAQVTQALAANQQALRDNVQAAAQGAQPPVEAIDLGPTNVPGMTPNPLSRHGRLTGRRPDGQGGEVPFNVQAWHFSHGLTVFQATVWRTASPANAKESTEAVETFAQGFKFSE